MDDECSVYNDRDEALVSNPLMGKLLQERWENNIRFGGRRRRVGENTDVKFFLLLLF